MVVLTKSTSPPRYSLSNLQDNIKIKARKRLELQARFRARSPESRARSPESRARSPEIRARRPDSRTGAPAQCAEHHDDAGVTPVKDGRGRPRPPVPPALADTRRSSRED